MKNIVLRIHQIIEFYQLSAASFADQVGVQRSSISHILSGRNKPSLDFILKTLKAFPTLSSEWLLHGKGSMEHPEDSPSAEKTPLQPSPSPQPLSTKENVPDTESAEIKHVLILRADGTFRQFKG